MPSPGRCVIVCGLPGSGKTATAKLLAQAHGALRLCPDEWMGALAIDLWDEPARARVETLQWAMAQELLGVGTSVVIEWGTWQRAERDLIRETCRASGAPVELRFLDVPLDVLWERVRARNAMPGEITIDKEHLEAWAQNHFEAPTAEELALFDPPNHD